MKITKPFKLTFWQTGLFKLCVLSFGILLGIYFRDFFMNFIPLLFILALGLGTYIGYVWYKQR